MCGFFYTFNRKSKYIAAAPFSKAAAFKRISPHLISLLCRICPRLPWLNKMAFLPLEGIFQTVLADIMGFAPMRVSQSRPHCVILWPDGSIIMVYAGRGGDRLPVGLWKTLFSLGCEIGGRKFWRQCSSAKRRACPARDHLTSWRSGFRRFSLAGCIE